MRAADSFVAPVEEEEKDECEEGIEEVKGAQGKKCRGEGGLPNVV